MWNFSDATKSIDESLHLSQAMFEYPAEFILAGDHILDQINPELVIDTSDSVKIPLPLLEPLLHYIGYRAHGSINGAIKF